MDVIDIISDNDNDDEIEVVGSSSTPQPLTMQQENMRIFPGAPGRRRRVRRNPTNMDHEDDLILLQESHILDDAQRPARLPRSGLQSSNERSLVTRLEALNEEAFMINLEKTTLTHKLEGILAEVRRTASNMHQSTMSRRSHLQAEANRINTRLDQIKAREETIRWERVRFFQQAEANTFALHVPGGMIPLETMYEPVPRASFRNNERLSPRPVTSFQMDMLNRVVNLNVFSNYSTREQSPQLNELNQTNSFPSNPKEKGAYNARLKLEQALPPLEKGYTRGIDGKNALVCPLCGVELGVGIPDYVIEKDEIKGPNDLPVEGRDDNGKGKDIIPPFDVPQYWHEVPNLTVVDAELSKRTFFTKCGHVYCGRCVKNIMNERGKRRKTPKNTKRKRKIGEISENTFTAPTKCIVTGCKKIWRGNIFVEMFW